MSKNVGVWVDHRKAVVVALTDSGEELIHIDSGAEKHVRSASGSRSKNPDGPQKVAPEDTLQRKLTHQLNDFYKQVIEHFREAKSIVILGPGEAKLELKKQIKSKEMLAKVAAVETSDKMTDSQLKIHVREFFQQASTK